MEDGEGKIGGLREEEHATKNRNEESPSLPTFDVVVILPDGREAAKVGDEYYLLKRGKPDFNQPVDLEDMKE